MTATPTLKVLMVVFITALAVAFGSLLVGNRAFFGQGGSLWISEDEGEQWSEVAHAKGIASLASLFAFTTSTPLVEEPFLLLGTRQQGLFLSSAPVHQNTFALLHSETRLPVGQSFAGQAPFLLTEHTRIYAIDQSRQNPRAFFLATFEDGQGKIIKWVKPHAGKEGPGVTQELYITALRNFGMFAVRVDPTNDRHLWAGGGDGLLVESHNGGASWTTTARFHEGILHILGHPVLAGRMWILGSRGALLTTSNGGVTWTQLNNGLQKAKAGAIHQLFYDAVNAHLLAGTDRGIIRSRDNGISWELLPLTIPPSALPVRSVAFHPQKKQTMVVSAANLIYKSKDGGISWDRNDLPSARTIDELIFSPKPPYPLYATVD